MRFDGTIVISGAGQGLGLALAGEFCSRGAKVLALVLHEDQRGAVEAIGIGKPGSLDTAVVDVTDPGDFAFPDDLSILVNNAAVCPDDEAIEHIPAGEWRRAMDVNFFGTVEMTRRAIPVLKRRRNGTIVNVNSGSIMTPTPFLAPYRASKGAIMAFSESLRCEVAPLGIRVLEILPGAMQTPMAQNSVLVRPAKAADHADYAGLALRQHTLYTSADVRVWPIEDAARFVVEAIADDRGRMRHGTDPVSDAAIVSGWRPDGGEAEMRGYIAMLND